MNEGTPKDTGSDKPAIAKPRGIWGTILAMTPVVLTVVATAFAGMSSSEMTKSMYYRSLAAQEQSKAGDQWAIFQAKRVRGTNIDMTAELLQSLTHPGPFDPAEIDSILGQVIELLERAGKGGQDSQAVLGAAEKVKKSRDKIRQQFHDTQTTQNLLYVMGPGLPRVEQQSLGKKDTQDALDAVVKAINQRERPEEIDRMVGKLAPVDLDEATRLAEADAYRFDEACTGAIDTLKRLRSLLGECAAALRPLRKPVAAPSPDRSGIAQAVTLFDTFDASFKAAGLGYEARRYRQEAEYNRRVANLDEVRVRRSGVESDQHRERSKHLFYSMLIAQLGVTVASLALARAQRSLLWLIAAAAGVAALGYGGVIYFVP